MILNFLKNIIFFLTEFSKKLDILFGTNLSVSFLIPWWKSTCSLISVCFVIIQIERLFARGHVGDIFTRSKNLNGNTAVEKIIKIYGLVALEDLKIKMN